jgi:hypothetical protein
LDLPAGVTTRNVIVLLGVVIVGGGFAVALLSGGMFSQNGVFGGPSTGAISSPLYPYDTTNGVTGFLLAQSGGMANFSSGYTHVIQTVTMMSTTTSSPGTSTAVGTGWGSVGVPVATNVSSGTGALIEFSSDISITASTPQQTASGVVALAYSVGGYVAYQSTSKDAAYVVIRVPASTYQSVLTKIESMGNFTGLVSNSNDVKVQYTDLNATLASLRTEEGALLKLLDKSTTVNSTLAIEAQLQEVDRQINEAQSQILQTKTLIDYSTITVTVSKSPTKAPLTMLLSATPTNGTAPLSVTFNAIVKGGAQPYLVNYNFGDGTAYQAQILVHTFYGSGNYRVTVTATDQNGTFAMTTTSIHVVAAPTQSGFGSFLGTVSSLFVNVVEGIVEVAVVVLPLAAVSAAVLVPLSRRSRTQKPIKQTG